MAHIRDLWTRPNPNGPGKLRTPRYGIGKRWQVRWVENGKQTTQTFATKDAAELHAARVETGQADGNWITKDKAGITLNDLWDPWLASKSNISEKSKKDYISYWTRRVQPQWGNTPVSEIKAATITAWIATLTTTKGTTEPRPLSASAMRKIGLLIHSMLDLAVELGYIHSNPTKTKTLPQQTKSERRYLRIDEVDALLAEAPTKEAKLLLEVMIMTGLRPGEAKALKVKDLDPTRGRLMIRRDVDDLGRIDATKTRQHRDVPIGGEILLNLQQAAEGKDPESWLIPDERGKVWTTARWRVIWKNMMTYLGITNFVTYELRHTAASIAIAAGADVKTVQLMLGHASAVETLNTYGHLWEEGLSAIPGAMEAHMAKERARIANSSSLKEESEAQRRRSLFRIV